MKQHCKRKTFNIILKKLGLIFILLIACLQIAIAQNEMNVSGTVSDINGEPLMGVSVKISGTSYGTNTNMEGRFQLANVPNNAKLEFSYVGMETIIVPVSGQKIINVTLKENVKSMDEVVVIGYGTTKRGDLTGSIASVNTEQLKTIPANSFEGLLQGRVAGIQIYNSSQEPGAASVVRVRGSSSLRASNSPLLVVDGFPFGDAGDMKQINPEDIVSIEVLKDASACAIYGSRGANGVIIITTKKPRMNKTTVTIRQQITTSQFTSKLNLWRDPVLMAMLSNEAKINAGLDPLYVGEVAPTGTYYPSIEELQTTWTTNTRWDELVFRKIPISNNTTISVAGGNEKTLISLSANFYTDNGVYIKDTYKKVGYNLTIDHNLFNNFKIKFNNVLYRGFRNSNSDLAYYRNPILPVYDKDGNYYLTSSQDFSHPIALTNLRKNTSDMLDIISSLALEWEIIKGLKFTSQTNYKFGDSTGDVYLPKKYTTEGTFNNGYGKISNWSNQNFVSEQYANYKNIFGKNAVDITAGHSFERYSERSSYLIAKDFLNEVLQNENMAAGNPQKNEIGNAYAVNTLYSLMLRCNYGFDDKYLATFTARADGASKFGKNNKWGMFPSGAVSWKAHNENFIKSINVFDELKFRLSYGISGNQGIPAYRTLSRYGNENYYNDNGWITAIGPGYVTAMNYIYRIWAGIPNPKLKWESTSQLDVGVDIGLLKNKLNITFDVYNKITNDLLRESNLTPSSGYSKIWVNDGSVQNRGYELTVDANIYKTKDWNINATFIFGQNKNKIISLGNQLTTGANIDPLTGTQFEYVGNYLDQYRQYANVLAVGQPILSFYGRKTDGIIQTLQEGIDSGLTGKEANPGEFKYVDIYKDGVIDEKDKTFLGSPNPDFTSSLNLGVRWKNLDASIFFNGVFGQEILNPKAFDQANNQPLRWTPDNPTNKYPSLRDGRQLEISDWWIQDGSYVRVQNFTLGYNIPMHRKILLNSARIYLNGSNLYTFTKFKGYDPEVNVDGLYRGGYPRLRKWTIGLDLNF
ncbi:TonB-linked outer membrane protein, SusC/RagA family [uncultured Paludibacter sp.]|uniref:TonB-linked outer membrane protein, SusC/RagA family n=1 Tax=uncultured Paludibacter sp. TaxID=497635 RepID=A0A653ACV5_9BACT|nr:TonB-linked outer membrane protein, SusC/RagA family [uncultured Paludibacter sp.]